LTAPGDTNLLFPPTAQTKQIGRQKLISWREQLLPVYRLSDLLAYTYPISKVSNRVRANGAAMLIIRSSEAHFALEVEDFANEQEMTIKPLNGIITPPNYIYGCTVMGNGNLIPAIDPVALLVYAKAQKDFSTRSGFISVTNRNQDRTLANHVQKTLIVDDSAMMRKTLALTLQKVGYQIVQAKDGEEAMELLRQDSAIDLIVSDLEMPKVNGFELLEQLRANPVLSSIPVIMLTTRSNDKHRRLALHLGAKAYLSKPYIEQEFLEVLQAET
jgi:two-component system, chemotaxis family, sensor histidine kinase and response regulator PixL